MVSFYNIGADPGIKGLGMQIVPFIITLVTHKQNFLLILKPTILVLSIERRNASIRRYNEVIPLNRKLRLLPSHWTTDSDL